MSTIVDEKWRVTIPKEIRKAIHIAPRTPVDVKLVKNAVVIKPVKRRTRSGKDSLDWVISHPASIRPKKLLTKEDLDKIEDEMWLP